MNIQTDSITFLSWDSINHIVYVEFYNYDLNTIANDSTIVIKKEKNRFSYINIPFLMGYNFTKGKLALNIRGGISLGFLYKKTGTYINYDLTNFKTADPKAVIVNYVVAPELCYNISKHFGINLTPQIIINTKNILLENNVTQKYNNIGISLGISYQFKEFLKKNIVANQ